MKIDNICIVVYVSQYCIPGFFRVLEIFAYFALFRKIAKKNLAAKIYLREKKRTDQENFQ